LAILAINLGIQKMKGDERSFLKVRHKKQVNIKEMEERK